MTMVMQLVSKAQFKSQLLEYLRAVESRKEPLVVTHAGKPVIKVSAYQEDPDAVLTSLRNSVLSFKNPTEPVGDKEWEVLQ